MKKKQSFPRSKIIGCFLAILLFICVNTRLSAQHFINEGSCLADTIDMGSFVIGTTPTAPTITAQAFEDANPNMIIVGSSIKIINGGESVIGEPIFTAITGMTFSIASPIITLTTTPIPLTSAGVTLCFTINVSDADGITPCSRIFKLKIVRMPIDIVFVLDISGSMSGRYNPTCVGAGCRTKIDELKSAVSLFFDRGLVAGNFTSTDKVSVIYFETGIDNADGTLVDWTPANITTPVTGLQAHVNAKPLGNTTNMNGGLTTANPSAVTAGRKKFIILFTDGMQNVSPLITSTGGSNPTVTIGGVAYSSASAPVKIYTIGLNAPSGAVYAMLGDIAHATNGIAYYNTTPAGAVDAAFALDQSFMNSFIGVLKGASPQIVDYRYKNAGGSAEVTESFKVNKGASSIILQYNSAGPGREVGIRIMKDGVDVTQFGRSVLGNGYRLFSMSFPKVIGPGDTIRSEGTWEMKIRSSFTSYQASAVVDDHLLNYTCSIDDKVHTVGDTLRMNVRLNLGNQPLADATSITAIVLKPGDDWGDLLASSNPQKKDTASADATTPAQAKGLALLSDSAYYNKLFPTNQVITLTNNSDGTYSGSFTGTELSGPYRIIYLIKGFNGVIGDYERTETFSVMFNFGQIDQAASEKTKTWNKDTLTLKFTPKNKFGKRLGPDYENRIKVTPAADRVIDNLDGSYTYIFYNASESTDPVITININGEEFYNGKASKFDEGSVDAFYLKWWFWVLLILILLILFFIFRKKKP